MSEFIQIDAHGRLAPEDESARQRLASVAGRFYLAPTAPDLLLGVRAPCLGGAGESPKVILAGDVSGFPLADLVAFLNQSRITGVLRVVTPVGERAILFKNGEVRGAASDDPADRLGEIATRLGLVQKAALERVLAANPHPNRIGRLLVDQGLLAPHDLWKCVQHQVAEIFHSILLSRDGAFMLVQQEVEDKGAALAINTQGLLMDAIRRIDEMAEFRKKVPNLRVYVTRKKPAGPELEPEEKAVYDLCTGDKTVGEIAQALRLSEFDATKLVHHLIEGHYLATSAAAAPAPGVRKAPGVAEVARVFNFIFKEIHKEISRVGMANEFVAAANGALLGQSSRAPVLQALAFGKDGTLDVSALMQNAQALGQAPAEAARTLHGALSELMFFLLFQASDLLDPKSDEDLARRVKELLATIESEA